MNKSLFALLAMLGLLLAGCDKPLAESTTDRAGTDTPTSDNAPPSTDTEPTTDDNDLSFLIRHGTREATPRPPATIRLATYNVENLFDDIDDPALSGRAEDIDDTIPQERRRPLADAIRAIDADILCLQEIESESALRWFMDAYLTGMGYDHVVSIDAGDERGIEQAVLSRFPITNTENWLHYPLGGTHPEKWGNQENWNAGEPILFHRSPLLVDIEIPSPTGDSPYGLTLVVVHQKSGAPGAYWRDAEARVLVELLAPLQDATRNIAILGDFNATSSQPSVQTYLDAGFHDLFGDQTGKSVVTHASGRRIDLILVNGALRPEIVDSSGFVLGTIQRPAGMSWRDPAPPGYAADHYPVVVDLTPTDR